MDKRSPVLGLFVSVMFWLSPLLFAEQRSVGEGESLPSLPESVLFSFDSEARQHVLQAYQSAKEKPFSIERVGRVGMLLHAHGHYESSARFYRYAARRSPSEFDWNYYLGLVERDSGRLETSAESFDRALSIQPTNLPARLHLAMCLIDLNRVEEGVSHLERVLKDKPGQPVAHYSIGRAYAKQGKTEEAFESFARACELAPDFGPAHYALALAYRDRRDTNRYQHHAALFKKYQDHWPSIEDPWLEMVTGLKVGAMAHFQNGLRLQAEGRSEEAVAEYRKVLRIRPGNAMANANLIGLYLRLGRLDEAERLYRACLEINPEIAEVHYNYGLLSRKRGRFQEAVSAFEKALEINPSYAEAHTNLGVLLAGSGQRARAAAHYRKALEIDQAHRLARYNLAKLLLSDRRNAAEAIELLSGALTEEDEKTATIEALLASAYAADGQMRQAETHGRRALRQAEQSGQVALASTVRYNLGRALFHLNEYGEVIELLSPVSKQAESRSAALLFLLASAYSRVGNQELALRHAGTALKLARRDGQDELADAIEKTFGAGLGDKP